MNSKIIKNSSKKKIIVQGEYPGLLHGLPSYVSMVWLLKTQKQAKELIETRQYIYKNLRIVKKIV